MGGKRQRPHKRSKKSTAAIISWMFRKSKNQRKLDKKLQAQANDGALPTEAGPSHRDPSMPGPSTSTTLFFPQPLPIPSSETDPLMCKTETDEHQGKGENYGKQELSTTTGYNQGPSTSVFNPISRLTAEPDRLPDGTLMVPLPLIEHAPIKQEIDDEDVKPLYVDVTYPPFATALFAQVHASHELKGHRIVDIAYLIEWCIDLKVDHLKDCPNTDLKIISEIHDGLRSDFVFHCDKCGFEIVKSTMDPDTSPPILRQFFAWKDSWKRSTWLFVHKMFNMFSIPFK